VVLGITACEWIPDPGPRLDQDDDGVPVDEDCDDLRPDLATLDQWDGELQCGGSLAADTADGADLIEWSPCPHPLQAEDLVHLAGQEQVWRLVTAEATEVRITLSGDGFVPSQQDGGGVAFVVFAGAVCRASTCTVALPTVREGVDSADPVVHLHSDAGQAWYVVVSGGADGSPYRLDVDCG
jgi:hypothetical protein